MNAIITYKEIVNFIEQKFRVCPTITGIDEKTVEVSYKPSVLMPAIGVKFHIAAMRKDIVCLTYDCGTAASLLIAGVVAYLDKKIPRGIDVNTTDKRINIYPYNVDELKNVLAHVSLNDVTFDSQSVNVELSMATS